MSEYYNHTFSDEEWEAIEEEADRLFRDSERRRGSIRGQVIQKEDHLHFWAAVAVQSRRAAPVVTEEMHAKMLHSLWPGEWQAHTREAYACAMMLALREALETPDV